MQYKRIDDYIEFNFAVNKADGNPKANPSGTFQVRKRFRPNSDAPVYTGYLTLLTDSGYPSGLMYALFQLTEANGFQYDTEYAVYCEVTADTSANPSGFLGDFKIMASGVTNPTVPPSASDPGYVTGYLYTYDENGDIEPSVVFTCKVTKAPTDDTGLALDTKSRTITSDSNGLATFPNLLPGATYSIKRGSGSGKSILIPTDAADPYELPDVLGID